MTKGKFSKFCRMVRRFDSFLGPSSESLEELDIESIHVSVHFAANLIIAGREKILRQVIDIVVIGVKCFWNGMMLPFHPDRS